MVVGCTVRSTVRSKMWLISMKTIGQVNLYISLIYSIVESSRENTGILNVHELCYRPAIKFDQS